MEKFSHPDEQVPTLYVVRKHGAVRINVADYDGKETVSAQSHFVPPGAPVEDETAVVDKTPAKGKTPKTATAPVVPPANEPVIETTTPKFVGVPKQWQANGVLLYTQGDDAGKFWRIDDKGVPLIATPFDDENSAAAAVVPTA